MDDTARPTPDGEGERYLPPGTVVGRYVVRHRETYPYRYIGDVYAADDGNGGEVTLFEYFPHFPLVSWRDRALAVRPTPDYAALFESGLRHFIAEGTALAMCGHSALPRVAEVVRANGTAYCVGMSGWPEVPQLWFSLEHGTLSEHDCRALTRSIADAMSEMHRLGVLHLGIDKNCVHFAPDRGIALLRGFSGGTFHLIREISRRGHDLTILLPGPYAPLELHAHSLPVGPFSDIYSVAAVLYEAVTLYVPHTAPQRAKHDILVPAAQAARGRYSEGFLRFIDAGMAVHAEDRPATIDDWLKLLAAPQVRRPKARRVRKATRRKRVKR